MNKINDTDCSDCFYAVTVSMTTIDIVECRRYPPTLIGNPDEDRSRTQFPLARRKCGEFQPEPIALLKQYVKEANR